MPANLRDIDGKYFALMLEYFDVDRNEVPTDCYALYDGDLHPMDIVVTAAGEVNIPSYSMMFRSNFDPPSSCQPYAFICKTSDNNFYRLPEDPDYFFGTEWLDYEWTDVERNYSYSCQENHYYFDSSTNEWIVNGGPTLSKNDIYYYDQGNDCIGCDAIGILECKQACIVSDFSPLFCNCSNPLPVTSDPTANPTTAEPTANPTTSPPTTAQPTTAVPSRVNPTSAEPTTAIPTTSTSSPTTKEPSLSPTELDLDSLCCHGMNDQSDIQNL